MPNDGITPTQVDSAESPRPNDGGSTNSSSETRSRNTRREPRGNAVITSTHRDFKGATPELGGVLALRSENVIAKTNYDKFCEILRTYIMKEMRGGEYVVDITKDPNADMIDIYQKTYKPKDLTASEKNSDIEVEIKKEEVKEYVRQLTGLKSNLKSIHSLIFGNCTDGVQAMLKADKDYETKAKDFDCSWILTKVKVITSGLDTKVNLRVSLHSVLMNFIVMRQYSDESNDAYLTRFKSIVETLKIAGGEHVLVSPKLMGKTIDMASPSEINAEKEHFLAICFIVRSDEGRYKKLLDDLKSSANRGRDEYPNTLTAAFDLLVRESGEYDTVKRQNNRFYRGRGGRGGRGRDSFMFAQSGRGGQGTQTRTNDNNSTEIVPGTDGATYNDVVCFGCGFKGHYRNQCPYAQRSGVISMHLGYDFAQQNGLFMIPDSWILLDTCSTCNVIKNPSLVTNIRDCEYNERLTAYTNGGAQSYSKLGELIMFPMKVHFKKNSMANILSLKSVGDIDGVRIVLDTSVGTSFYVSTTNGTVYEFKQFHNGLYYFDTSTATRSNKSKTSVTNYSMLQTVDDNKQYFTSNEIKGADLSRKYQEYLFYPGTKTLTKYVANNLINNSQITVDDVNRGELIYGPPVPYIQGHMTRKKPPMHEKIEKIPLPLMIQQHHSNIALAMDFFYVNGNIFFHTKSNKVDFTTAQYCTSRSLRSIMTALEKVQNKYSTRSFNITDYHGDNEFDKSALKDFLLPALIHIYGRNEHVGPIERATRTIKERARSTCNGTPYKRITILMVRSLIEAIVEMLNAFPSKGSISDTLSPSTIVEGKPKLDLSKDIIVFGAYALVYTDTTNDMKSRAVPAIALRRSNNAGGHYFMSLYSGKRIHGYRWKELPIDDYVISRVEELAEAEKQPLMHNGLPNFEWSPGTPITDDFETEEEGALTIGNNITVNDMIEDENDMNQNNMLPENDDINNIEEAQVEINDNIDEEMMENNEDGLIAIIEDNIVSDEDDIIEPDMIDEDNITEESNSETNEDINAADNIEMVATLDNDEVTHNEYTHDRPRRANAGTGVERLQMDTHGKEYGTMREFNLLHNDASGNKNYAGQNAMMQTACDIIFTQMSVEPKLKKYAQMSAKRGFKVFGQAAVAAIIKEFSQLNDGAVPGKPVVVPIDVTTITSKEKEKALSAVNLIKEKRSGDIKGRTCVDGSKQRKYLKPDESVSSPTVSTESLIATLLIDAYEQREVAIFDVPGAFLQAELKKKDDNERVLMRLEGEFVDIMCDINPEHIPNVTYERGKKVLYLEILQAIYGCLESSLRWYELYAETLQKEGFIINPYDRCVANKEINGLQCTIAWYVDDNKVSHKEKRVVDEIIELIKSHFGELSVSRGREQKFLGMNIKIREDKKIEIEMKDQLREAIDMFTDFEGNKIEEVVASPAQKHLRESNDDCIKLVGEKCELFHSIVAKLR